MTVIAIASGAIAFSSTPANGQDLLDLLDRALPGKSSKIIKPKANSQPTRGPDDAEPFAFNTADGWTLVVHRYSRPADVKPRAGEPPILLCHGLGYNAMFWDLNQSVSLARELASRGYDVWAVSLRGSGLSRKWVFRIDQVPEVLLGSALRRLTKGKMAATGYSTIDPKYADWTLDDHIQYDVPAAVAFVRKRTGAERVVWIGHSMGGMIALCHLGLKPNPGIDRLVVIGSQVTMSRGHVLLEYLKESLSIRERLTRGLRRPEESLKLVKSSADDLFFNQRNVSPEVYRALTGYAKESSSLGVLKQYLHLANKGSLADASGKRTYVQTIENVDVPILIMSGAADQLAPPQTQYDLFDRVGSSDKTLILLGREHGLSVDYGHNDAIVGLSSAQEVYPLIERWLQGDRFDDDRALKLGRKRRKSEAPIPSARGSEADPALPLPLPRPFRPRNPEPPRLP